MTKQAPAELTGFNRSFPANPEVLPVLTSLNIEETQRFYSDCLGFDQFIYQAQDYLILRRAHMELHFWVTDNRAHCEISGIYIRGGGIYALYEEFAANKVPSLSPFKLRPWKMMEFYIWDPHGNLLKFGRVPEEDDLTVELLSS